MKGKRLVNGNFTYKEFNIVIKDSVSLIAMPLSKFGDIFKLDQEKEVMPYKFYNKYTIDRVWNKIELVKKYLDEKEYK